MATSANMNPHVVLFDLYDNCNQLSLLCPCGETMKVYNRFHLFSYYPRLFYCFSILFTKGWVVELLVYFGFQG